MINRACLLFISALLLLLAGCASSPQQSSVQVIKPDAVSGDVISPQPGVSIIAELAIKPTPMPIISGNQAVIVTSNQAVIALLDRARLDTGVGKQEAAGSSLERALRIEPRNPWLWNELAQVRLAQGQYAQAISLAQKANSFAVSDRRVQASNWRVIGNARVAQGNRSGADQAFKRAAEFEQ